MLTISRLEPVTVPLLLSFSWQETIHPIHLCKGCCVSICFCLFVSTIMGQATPLILLKFCFNKKGGTIPRGTHEVLQLIWINGHIQSSFSLFNMYLLYLSVFKIFHYSCNRRLIYDQWNECLGLSCNYTSLQFSAVAPVNSCSIKTAYDCVAGRQGHVAFRVKVTDSDNVSVNHSSSLTTAEVKVNIPSQLISYTRREQVHPSHLLAHPHVRIRTGEWLCRQAGRHIAAGAQFTGVTREECVLNMSHWTGSTFRGAR